MTGHADLMVSLRKGVQTPSNNEDRNVRNCPVNTNVQEVGGERGAPADREVPLQLKEDSICFPAASSPFPLYGSW